MNLGVCDGGKTGWVYVSGYLDVLHGILDFVVLPDMGHWFKESLQLLQIDLMSHLGEILYMVMDGLAWSLGLERCLIYGVDMSRSSENLE